MLASPSSLDAPDDLGPCRRRVGLREGLVHTLLCIRDSHIRINSFPTLHYIHVHTNTRAIYPFDYLIRA